MFGLPLLRGSVGAEGGQRQEVAPQVSKTGRNADGFEEDAD